MIMSSNFIEFEVSYSWPNHFQRLLNVWRCREQPEERRELVVIAGEFESEETPPESGALLCKVDGQFVYIGIDSEGDLQWSPIQGFDMMRSGTKFKHVMTFGSKDDYYLTGRVLTDNTVRGEKHPKNEANYWYVRTIEESRFLLQFYGKDFRECDWKKLGRFFIIKIENDEFKYKIGDYDSAMEEGIFNFY